MKSVEEKLKEAICKGEDADSWLNHPAFRYVISLRKAQLINAFETTKYSQAEEREEIWRKVQALNTIKQDFEKLIRDCKSAAQKLEKLNQSK